MFLAIAARIWRNGTAARTAAVLKEDLTPTFGGQRQSAGARAAPWRKPRQPGTTEKHSEPKSSAPMALEQIGTVLGPDSDALKGVKEAVSKQLDAAPQRKREANHVNRLHWEIAADRKIGGISRRALRRMVERTSLLASEIAAKTAEQTKLEAELAQMEVEAQKLRQTIEFASLHSSQEDPSSSPFVEDGAMDMTVLAETAQVRSHES